MKIAYEVPLVFIDSVIDEEFSDPEEYDTFKEETSKVIEFLKTDDPYRCNDTCRSTDYSNGIPYSVDNERGNTKTGWFLEIIWYTFYRRWEWAY